jgi:hypothetical protein
VSKGFDLNDKGHHEVSPRASGAGLYRHGAEGRGLEGEPTQSYAEAGAASERRGVFSPEDLRLYRAVVGFRNVLVHGYTSV